MYIPDLYKKKSDTKDIYILVRALSKWLTYRVAPVHFIKT